MGFQSTGLKVAFLTAVWGLAVFFIGGTAGAQTASEPACAKGSAEACFYAGAEYAQGAGAAANQQTAVQFFLKACSMGIPDGCSTAGYLTWRGEGNVRKDLVTAAKYLEQSCRMGHENGCKWSIDLITVKSSPAYDPARAVAMAEVGCEKNVKVACQWGAIVSNDGEGGRMPEQINLVRAAKFGEKGCSLGDGAGCIISEMVFANPESELFDAGKSLRYTKINCGNGSGASCSNLGSIYVNIGEYELATVAYEQSCKLKPGESICNTAKEWRKYITEVAAYEAQQAERTGMINSLTGKGQYGAAVNTALHQYRSKKYAEMAVLAASGAGRMSDLNIQDLYVLASWFPSGPVRGAVNREMSRRGTGLEGTFGSGTNTAGAADARYRQLYGSAAPRASSSTSSASRPAMLSASQAATQTRDKYRTAHCTMSGNANRNVCR